MKKITLGLLMFCCFAFSLQSVGQSVATQLFEASGVDSDNFQLSIDYSDITVNQGQTIQSVSISNYESRYYSPTGSQPCLSAYEWFYFDLNVTGGTNDGLAVVNGCEDDYIGLDVSGFSNLTFTSVDPDDYSDDVFLFVTLEVTYETPSCPAPSSMVASNVTTSSADLSWISGGSETQWNLEWKAGADFTPGNAEEDSSDTVSGLPEYNGQLSALTPNTDYYFYYQANCGGDTSAWIPFTFTTLAETPNCATTPTPTVGATGILVGDMTISWSAPASGPTPTAYNVYVYDDEFGANPGLIGTVTETTMDVTVNAYETTIYWSAIPVNVTVEATGCDIWYFTTENTPPPPVNDDCSGAVSITVDESFCDGTNNNGDNSFSTDSGLGEAECFNYGLNDVWFAFTVPTGIATVDISTDFTGGTLVDTEIAVYSGVCGTLVEQDCDNDSGTTTLSNGFAWNSVISDFPVVVGETYYVRVSGYNSERVGTFCLDIATNQALGLDDVSLSQFTYFPNPVNDKLTLNAQSNIQNVAVYNMLGQEVINASPNTLDAEVDMVNLNSGAYFVKVTIDNATKTIRVIKN